MFGSWSPRELPNLNPQNCELTSKAANRYNCIAWAARDLMHNWWPDPWGIGYWPPNVPRELTLEAFIQAYGTLGYAPCQNGLLQPDLEKIALFSIVQGGRQVPTHAALQLANGEWTSKLGPLEDVVHKLVTDVNGPAYGTVACFLSRQRRPNGISFLPR